MKFREYLEEMSIARNGDYDFGNLNYINKGRRLISISGIKVIKEIKHPRTKEELYVVELTDTKGYLCLARIVQEHEKTSKGELIRIVDRYEIILAMVLETVTKYRGLGYGPFKIIKGVEVKDTERKNGYGSLFYKTLVNDLKYVIMGDLEQYNSARELWVSLSSHPEYYVDIVNTSNAKILYKDIKLKDALDSRIWSDEDLLLTDTKEEKKVARFHRLVLTSVK